MLEGAEGAENVREESINLRTADKNTPSPKRENQHAKSYDMDRCKNPKPW